MGQSFLVDPFVADAEAALLDAAPGTSVVEIGGGLGILTEALLRRGVEPLSVVERDARLASHLRARFPREVRVIEGDALVVDIPADSWVVGNLPFSVATSLLVRLWKRRVPRMVVMLQREVAERVAAAPGTKAYGRLSILAALFGSPELFQTVPSDRFEPAPEVEGRVLLFVGRQGPLPVPSVDRFERLLRSLFSARRKQLGNLLPRVAPSREAAEQWARSAAWPSDWARKRPEELPSEAFFALARAVGELPVPARGA